MEEMFEQMKEFIKIGRKTMRPEDVITKLLENAHIDMLTSMRTSIDARIKELSAQKGDELNPFTILGVDRTSTRSELEKVYKDKAWNAHPDRGGSNEDMVKINSAYAAIKAIKGWK